MFMKKNWCATRVSIFLYTVIFIFKQNLYFYNQKFFKNIKKKCLVRKSVCYIEERSEKKQNLIHYKK